MRINFDSIKPIYAQVAEAIEDDIVTGKLKEGEAAYSQLILSREFAINPATAAKGINQLVSKGILEKQRGLSMIVAAGAREKLLNERINTEVWQIAESLVDSAIKVGLNKENVIEKITKLYEGRNTNE
ncbi:MAG: GntR family transcriptional regulator [Oscillospiraceae bacterium]|nr:GntR family transcriptional regulator [Oscillospiraceae bacterium]